VDGHTSIFEDIALVYGQSHPAVSFALRGLDEPLTIKADPGHLRQLFVNLVSNAIDAMGGRGTVSISVDLVKYAQTHYCRVEVRDTGPGIPADLQPGSSPRTSRPRKTARGWASPSPST
jgi:signal transduction histidine kinase